MMIALPPVDGAKAAYWLASGPAPGSVEGKPAPFHRGQPMLMQPPSADDEQQPESEKSDVPRQRRAEVIANVVHAKDVMIDQPFDDVEGAPSGQHQAEVEAPTSVVRH
jgi:hypothetical protein